MSEDLVPVPMNELFNVAHERPFSLLFSNYSFLLGVAGGVAIIWVINAWLGRRDTPGFRLAMPITVALILAGFMNVLAEVHQPSRLIYGYIFGWAYAGTSIIKYGIILLPLFLALSWWLMFQSLDPEALKRGVKRLPSPVRQIVGIMALWSWRYRLLDMPGIGRAVLVVLVLLGLFAQAYSGIFLMNEHGVPLWNSPAQVILFVLTGIAGGAAVHVAVIPLLNAISTGRWMRPAQHYHWSMLGAVVLAGIVWYAWLWWIARFGDIPNQRASALLFGPYFSTIVWHTLVIGLAVPFVALVLGGRNLVADVIASIGVLWGAYALRYLILIAGQALNRSGAGYLGFTPNSEVIWYTAFEALIAVSVAVFLAATLPINSNATVQARKEA